MEDRYSSNPREEQPKMPEARYAYYRRCQIFRKGGEQCKAPAEKGSHICHAHRGQLGTAVRRERERRAVLEEAVFRMRKNGKPECKLADLFMDLKGIQVTMAVMARALIDGRIDCKTAGRVVVQLQTLSKLLRMLDRTKTKALPRMISDNTDLKESAGAEEPTHDTETIYRKVREGRKENQVLPQICAVERRLGQPEEKAHLTTESRRHGEQPPAERNWTAIYLAAHHWDTQQGDTQQGEETRVASVTKVRAFADRRGWGHAPPELLRAA